MSIHIDAVFQQLIPRLRPEELAGLEANTLGFRGFREEREELEIMPSTMGALYWLWSHKSLKTGIETYQSRPCAVSRLPLQDWKGFQLLPVHMAPRYDYLPPERKAKKWPRW